MSNYICQIRCSYRQPNGYCGSTGGWERCQYRQLYQPNTVVGYVPPLKKTNADRIRAMTDEELATWFNCMQSNAYHCGEFGRTNAAYPFDNKAWLEWLKQEATE